MAENQNAPQQNQLQITNSHLINHVRKNIILVIIFFILGISIGYGYEKAQTKTVPQTITVIGKASQDVKADKEKLTGSTYTNGIDDTKSADNDKKTIAAIRSKLTELGINQDNFKILSSYTEANYADQYGPTPMPSFTCMGACPSGGGGGGSSGGSSLGTNTLSPAEQKPTGYYTSTSFEIYLDKATIDKETDIITFLSTYSITTTNVYNISDKQTISLQNKEKAIQDARDQAEMITKSNKTSIKKLLSIKEIVPTPDPNYLTDPTTDSYSQMITFTNSFEVTYEIGTSLFSLW